MTMLSNLELMRRVPLFSMLNDDQLTAVAKAVVKRRFKRGASIVEQGKTSNALFILLNGRARVIAANSRGREVILAVMEPGSHVGEMSLIDHEPHSATVRAEMQTDVLMLGSEDFARCLRENPSMTYAMMCSLVQRLRNASRRIETLALMDVYGRVARALLEFAVDAGDGEMLVQKRISRQDIAKMIGASREMVSRVMKGLEENGFIETLDNGSILIRSPLNTLC
ncbi:MAG: Crp/Fnr family transcriptional regulator [Desulfovibrionaceae bacterium]|jgi:CRP-like cAMP-binding protein|nr:Crp/Fnr family transcriptional regulator [Desulfovibrionaceae bacterium]